MIAVSVGPEPDGVPAGVVHAGGGSRGLLALLDEQVRRHARQRVPAVDEDPAWILCETGAGPLRRRVTESLFTLGAGGVATRGSVEEAAPGAQPMVLAAGVYDGTGPGQHLLPGPVWTGLAVEPAPAGDRRVLDLRTGVLERTELTDGACPLRTLRLASITIPGVVAMRAEAPAARLPRPGRPLRRPPGTTMAAGREDGMHWARTGAGTGAGIAAVAVQRTRRDGAVRTVQRVAAYAGNGRYRPGLRAAADALRAADSAGFDRLLADHRAAWAAPVGCRRRPGPRRPPGAAGVAVRVVPAVVRDQGPRRAGRRRAGAVRHRILRSRVLGRGRVHASRGGGHGPGGRCRDDPLPAAAAGCGPGPGPRRRAARRPFPVGVRGQRRGRHAGQRPARRTEGADPDRPARGAHHR